MKKILLLLSISLLVWPLIGQTTYSKEVEAQIKQFENSLAGRIKIEGQENYNIADRMAFYKIKGLSVAVVRDYQVVWAKGYGWADESEKRPVTTETLFEPGSISKSLNAVGILKLVQDKKLDLYTDINTYLTSWKFPYDSISNSKKITLAQLLSHSAGLGVHGFPGYDRLAKIPTLQQVLDGEPPANTPAVRSEFEPGLKYQYSGGGTTISQLILTDMTRQPYDVFMYDHVLKPMGMVNSFYTQPAPKEKQHLCATGYYGDGSPVAHQFHVYPEQAAAGLWMTPTDLCHYIIETQLAYEGRSSKVLNQEMTKLRLTPYNDEVAALGVFVENRNGVLYFQHGAGNEGFCGQYFGSVEGGNGVAVFLNTDNPGSMLEEVVNSVASVYNWTEFYKPVTKKVVNVPDAILQKYPGFYRINESDFGIILKKEDGYYLFLDGTSAKMLFTNETDFFNLEFGSEKHFVTDGSGNVTAYKRTFNGQELPQAFKISNPDTLQGSEQFFNGAGWSYLQIQDYEAAIRFLQRGLSLYPGSLLIQGNLAHGYLFNKDYAAALKIYQSHLNGSINGDISWNEMIQQDFLFFKKRGFDKSLMDKIFADLKLEIPEGY